MKTTGKTRPAATPVFDAEGYQTNLAALNGTSLPPLGRVQAQPLHRGGARVGAGRKATGRKPILLRLTPAATRALRLAARRQGRTLSEVAEEQLLRLKD